MNIVLTIILLNSCASKKFNLKNIESITFDSVIVMHKDLMEDKFMSTCCNRNADSVLNFFDYNYSADGINRKVLIVDTAIIKRLIGTLLLSEKSNAKNIFVDARIMVAFFYNGKYFRVCLEGSDELDYYGNIYINKKFNDFIILLLGPNLYEYDYSPDNWKYSKLKLLYPDFPPGQNK